MRVRLLIVAGLLVLLLLPSSVAVVSAGPNCQFVLGFKAIHDQIPDVVGDCLVNERHEASTGNTVQETTAWHGKGGLLVWRKADNWTAFTDGSHTWVNGPNGLQKRRNEERFAWEQDPIPTTTPAPTAQAGNPAPWIDDTRLMAICDAVAEDITTASLPYLKSGTNLGEYTKSHAITCKLRAMNHGYTVPTCYRRGWLDAIGRIPWLANPSEAVPQMAERGYTICMAAS